MKKFYTILLSVFGMTAFVACSDEVKRNPNDTYMPDMANSRAYETYSDHSKLKDSGINYTNMPVAGTIARGEEMPFHLAKDKQGDTANYTASKLEKSPIDSLSKNDLVEAERLYLINCGICHGAKLDGNGPLYKGGDGPYPAKPATLVGDKKYESMPVGQMYYSVTYGKNLMGSYASQLNRKQRWQVIAYIKQKQAEGKAATKEAVATK
jgi:mono/diheme cytochrome c family protein